MTEKKLEFSEDELVHPEYLNTEFFTNVMKEYKKDKDIKVVILSIIIDNVRIIIQSNNF